MSSILQCLSLRVLIPGTLDSFVHSSSARIRLQILRAVRGPSQRRDLLRPGHADHQCESGAQRDQIVDASQETSQTAQTGTRGRLQKVRISVPLLFENQACELQNEQAGFRDEATRFAVRACRPGISHTQKAEGNRNGSSGGLSQVGNARYP